MEVKIIERGVLAKQRISALESEIQTFNVSRRSYSAFRFGF